jgi:dUTP pyrophosphatase
LVSLLEYLLKQLLFMEIKIVNLSTNELPKYETSSAAGMDIRAYLTADVELMPMQRYLVPTGLYIELPDGYEAQIRPRSGLAFKHGVTVLNSPGTIDPDYRGELKILLANFSDTPFVIKNGERVAQLVVSSYSHVYWKLVKELSATKRGDSGYGSTGLK